jgi:hypothetical protein
LTDKHVVLHHSRDPDGEIAVRIVRGGSLTLDPPGLVIDGLEVLDGL